MKIDNTFLSWFQFVGSRVSKCKIQNDYVNFNINENDLDIDITPTIHDIQSDEENKCKSGIIELDIVASYCNENNLSLKFELTIEGCFVAPLDAPKDIFYDMLGMNGAATVYSLARSYIKNVYALTADNGSLVLPMINMVELYNRCLKKDNLNTTESTEE